MPPKKKLKRKPLTQAEQAERYIKGKLKLPKAVSGNLANMVSVLPEEALPTQHLDQHGDRLRLVRNQALIDYVTDPESRSIDYHYNRRDRFYTRYVSPAGFKHWADKDGWTTQRERFWGQLTLKILEQEQERLLAEQKREIEQLQVVRTHLVEHLMPLTDEAGEVLRYPEKDKKGRPHELAGKPVLPYYLGNYAAAIKAFLAVDERLMTKRGEVTQRIEQAGSKAPEDPTPGVSPLNPVTRAVEFSPEQLRLMARAVLREKQPELAALRLDIDVESDDDK